MKILVIGGTRFFGIHMVNRLIEDGHEVTIATRGISKDSFFDKVNRIIFDRNNPESIYDAFHGKHFDVAIDKIAYCSNDIRNILNVLDINRYIYMSTTAVYNPKKNNTVEEDFNPLNEKLIWCDRSDYPYNIIKRSAESALTRFYPNTDSVSVRYPVVLGKDDYTKRLMFYVEHIIKNIPMNIDNLNNQMSFIRSDEAGEFMAFLVNKDFSGPVNGSSKGTISLNEIVRYTENKTGRKAIIDSSGESAPYNGEADFSINTDKAENLGFIFSNLNDWIYPLLDYYIDSFI